jgi:hypothetical protein
MDRKRHRRAVAELVNRERRSRGLGALRFTLSLRMSAHAWALAITRSSRFTHGAFAKRVLRFPSCFARATGAGRLARTSPGGSVSPRLREASWRPGWRPPSTARTSLVGGHTARCGRRPTRRGPGCSATAHGRAALRPSRLSDGAVLQPGGRPARPEPRREELDQVMRGRRASGSCPQLADPRAKQKGRNLRRRRPSRADGGSSAGFGEDFGGRC